MGRHSIDPAPSAPAPDRGPVGPITDPVLLDAVQRELRRLRIEDRAQDRVQDRPAPATHPVPATRRVETPFSGPVDVPVENVIGPFAPPPVPAPRSWAPLLDLPQAATPQPVPARSSTPHPASTGPVIVPTHRPAPVPVDAPHDDLRTADDPQWRGPLGLSTRTALLTSGIGALAATALSLLTLIPR